jgi:RNA polymerase sigma-70 factor, ECF subfamily
MSNTVEQQNKNLDSELIERFVSGDEPAFETLVHKHAPKAYQISFGLLGNKLDAEEVVQDSFIKVYKNLDKFRGDSSFTTWLYRIVTNLSRNKYHWHRRRGSEVNVSMSNNYCSENEIQSDMEIPDDRLEPSKALENRETGMKLTNAIKKLSDKLKEVIILRHIEDMSYSDIAGLLHCELGTVKSRLARAREALKLELAGSEL